MIRVWLTRHGETQWNVEHRLQGLTDSGLTDGGRTQAFQLALKLADRNFDSVCSSDLRRAVETAEILSDESRIDPRLREFDFGDIEGLTWNELPGDTQRSLLDFDRFTAPNGESTSAMQSRISSFMNDLVPGDHLVITHGGVVRIVSALCGEPSFPDHCQPVIVDWTERRILLES